jgi:hypothetical protein
VGKWVERSSETQSEPPNQGICSATTPESAPPKTPGQRSNPHQTSTPPSTQLQRRLTPSDVDDICANYAKGKSIDQLAQDYGIHRTTIITHLQNQGVPRRRILRKMTDDLAADAAVMYLDGHSLASTVAEAFNVDTRTLGREFRKAGVPIRARRRWTY